MVTINNMTASGLLPMAVRSTAFLVDRLGQDCHPLQFLRELTQNGIEAIGRSGEPGQIVWDADHYGQNAEGKPLYKLSVVDTGQGMTADEMGRYINELASSGSLQGINGNFGLGAKIAAATRNPFGVIYQSWRNGEGNMIYLHRDAATGQYGLKQWELDNDHFAYHMPLSLHQKPDLIADHGTKVVLLGRSAEEDTLQPPEGTPSPSRWVAKYLNTRYFRFPRGVEVRVREGWQQPSSDTDRNLLRTITGMKDYLESHCQASGSVKLTGAVAYWWILKDEPALAKNSGHIESVGHVAALYRDELYELRAGLQGTAWLQQFGVIYGARQIVIYVEPLVNKRYPLTTNTARTSLLRGSEPLPWAEWAEAFRRKMPPLLRRFIDKKAAGASATDHRSSIRRRLRGLMSLYKITRYRADPRGPEKLAAQTATAGGSANHSTSKKANANGALGSTASGHNRRQSAQDGQGKASRKVDTDPFPQVVWISVQDGTRDPGYLEDRAAAFLLDENLLQINEDFSGFDDMIDHCYAKTRNYPGARDAAETIVRSWFEQALVETVIGVQQLRQRKHWSPRDVETALSPAALTGAVMQRYHIAVASQRELTRRLGKPLAIDAE